MTFPKRVVIPPKVTNPLGECKLRVLNLSGTGISLFLHFRDPHLGSPKGIWESARSVKFGQKVMISHDLGCAQWYFPVRCRCSRCGRSVLRRWYRGYPGRGTWWVPSLVHTLL